MLVDAGTTGAAPASILPCCSDAAVLERHAGQAEEDGPDPAHQAFAVTCSVSAGMTVSP